MEEQNNEFKWIHANLLFGKIRRTEGRYGDYIVAVLADGNKVIIDNKNLRALVSTIDKPYSVLGFKTWIKKGFILVSFPREDSVNEYDDRDKYNEKYNDKEKYYILNAKDGSIVGVGKAFDAYAFLEGKSDYFLLTNEQGTTAIFNKDGKQVSDWFDWIDICRPLHFGEADYCIVRKGDKRAIFHKSGRQVTNWFDLIYYYDSYYSVYHVPPEYYRVRENSKSAIFRKDGHQVSDWYDDIDLKGGLLEGRSDYFIAKKDGKYAIFDKNGRQISDWFDWIGLDGLIFGESNYYIAEKKGKRAIFDKDGNQISSWFYDIDIKGLVEGQSVFYKVKNNGKRAIFHKDGTQISDWFDDVDSYGLVMGQSDYYVAIKNVKVSIFDKNGKQVSDWFDVIYPQGLIWGKSDYYLAKKGGKVAIFHKDGRQVTDWLDKGVYVYGVLEGNSDYYVVYDRDGDGDEDEEEDEEEKVVYICKLGSSKVLGPFKGFRVWDPDLGFIENPSSTSVKVHTLDGKEKIISKQEVDQFFEEGGKDYDQTR